jgi:hypothetical protein
MSRDADGLLADMIEAIGRSAGDLPDIRLTGFLGMKGAAYNGDLMWVGRALNGWSEGPSPSEVTDPHCASAFAEAIKSHSVQGDSEPCILHWVIDRWGKNDGDYNSARSAFWRVAKRTLLDDDERDDIWSSRLVWSNLYKIAPSLGGNPSGRLAAIEFPFCRDLLLSEIAEFRPKRIVFATGEWAMPFIDHAMFVRHDHSGLGQYVLGLGDVVLEGEKIGKFVIAPHPQGKRETQWVREVKAALGGAPPILS